MKKNKGFISFSADASVTFSVEASGIAAKNKKEAWKIFEVACCYLTRSRRSVGLKRTSSGGYELCTSGKPHVTVNADTTPHEITSVEIYERGYREEGWCSDCKDFVHQKIVIMTCSKNPRGIAGRKHGNDNECDDAYCNRSYYSDNRDYEWDGKGDINRFDHAYRCDVCDTLNVEANGCKPPPSAIKARNKRLEKREKAM